MDIDDIILNITGGLVGYIIYKFSNNFSYKLPKFLKKSFILDILSLLFVLAIMYIVIKAEFWRYLS